MKKIFEQAKLATKADVADLITKTYFDYKLKNTNKKVSSNKIKNLELKWKLTDLLKKVLQMSIKGNEFLLGRVSFISDDGYQKFLTNIG